MQGSITNYIPADKLIAEIERRMKCYDRNGCEPNDGKWVELITMKHFIKSLQQEQPANMIQWTGNNLQEVIDFTGKSPRFGEWFNSWEEYENYVHTHNDILKLFCEDGNHFEVPVGAWIIKTPDGHNVPSVARFIHTKQEQPKVELEEKIQTWCKENVTGVNPIYTADSLTCYLLPKTARHFYELGLNARKKK